MSRRLALAGLLLALWAPTALAQRPFAADLLPTRSATARLGLERQWWAAVPMGDVHERILNFNVDGGTLFIHTSGGNLHAYDAESGRYLWVADLGPSTAEAFPVATNSDQAFVTSLKTLFAIDRRSGQIMWKAELDHLPSTGTGADEEAAMVGLRSGKLVAYNARNRTQEKPPGRSEGTFNWAWQTRAQLSARPVVTPKVVAFGSQDHRVYVAQKGDFAIKSQLLFRFLTSGPISANLATWGNRTLIAPSGDQNVYAVDLFTGQSRWSVATGASVDQEPLVQGADVFAINAQGRVLAIDGGSGTVKWDRNTPAQRLIAISPSRLYFETREHDLMILDRSSGQVLADARATLERAGLNLRDFSLSFPNYQNDRLYFCTPSGLLVCLREMGRTQPVPLRDPSWPPFGTIPPDGLLTNEDSVPPLAKPKPAPAEEGEAMPPPDGESPDEAPAPESEPGVSP